MQSSWAVQVNCVDRLEKRISIFEATENNTSPYNDVTFVIPNHECFIDEPITLSDENDTLTILATNNQQITSITFARPSNSTGFPSIIFELFPKLSDVHLISTGLEALIEDDFAKAAALKRLRIELNNIERITVKTFAQPNQLEILELPANHIHEIDNYAFSKLKNLIKLDLQQNNLTMLHELTFSGAVNLMEIYLNDNQIEFIDDGSLYLPKLEKICLQDNRLKSLSVNLLTGTPALYGIDLSRNQLESIQNVFNKCKNLTIIGLNHNQIKSIDLIELADLESLRVLSMEGNQLQIDANHSVLEPLQQRHNRGPFKTHLEYLNLDSNNLSSSSILNELMVFRRLRFLDLDDNRLTKLENFKEIRTFFPHFIQINMNENPLSCAWLEDALAFIEQSGIIFQTLEVDSVEDESDAKVNKFAGSNQKKVNGITCNIEDEPFAPISFDYTAATPPFDGTIA